MPKILKATRFGNPILRSKARRLNLDEIGSDAIQSLIENMRYTLYKKEYGVGIAAPQVGVDVALSVIGIKPTPNRPDLDPFKAVIINPEIIETYGKSDHYGKAVLAVARATIRFLRRFLATRKSN